ncbi:MAG: hypothetical protein SCJ97_02210 [Bacillota bacterium]|nr:hypothetical protein [Bacillota bacterium]
MSFNKIEEYIKEKTGFPLRDRYDLPTSQHSFPDGSHYRIEIAGIETVKNLEIMTREAERRNVPVHRVISLVRGSAMMDNTELKEFAAVAADNKYEVIINPLPSRAWDSGRQYATPEGYVSGMRIRGSDKVYEWLKEFDRCLEAGIRGFLIVDEGLLALVTRMRTDGIVPKDVKYKVSVFAGHGSPYGAKLLEDLGADSFNPLGDLTLPMLASIRSTVKLPLDVYVSLVETMGGFQRYHECPDIARIAAPVYFKIEPGRSESEMYNSWVDDNLVNHLAAHRVKIAEICIDWVERAGIGMVLKKGGNDLSIPKP